jgi:hypothetical protein
VKDKKISLALSPPFDFLLKSEELWKWDLEKLTTVYE